MTQTNLEIVGSTRFFSSLLEAYLRASEAEEKKHGQNQRS
jgi:hypothetical protein